jgi:hypothetical protein
MVVHASELRSLLWHTLGEQSVRPRIDGEPRMSVSHAWAMGRAAVHSNRRRRRHKCTSGPELKDGSRTANERMVVRCYVGRYHRAHE